MIKRLVLPGEGVNSIIEVGVQWIGRGEVISIKIDVEDKLGVLLLVFVVSFKSGLWLCIPFSSVEHYIYKE